jgi:formylglycine-generating enzyme required for sulfatase activity
MIHRLLCLLGLVTLALLPWHDAPRAAVGTRAGQTWTNPKEGSTFVFVPAGGFTMGSNGGDADERPAHKVNLRGYWIGKNEVTVAQYRRFCREIGRPMPRGQGADNHPVVNVSWDDAVAYARWAGCRLPTEAEWEKAARGTDARTYPWGNTWDPAKCNTEEGGPGRTMPVGSYPRGASPYGCLDMAGNVSEWCSSVYKKYPYRADDGREDPNAPSPRVYRGGSWDDDRDDARASERDSDARGDQDDDRGFRLARSS